MVRKKWLNPFYSTKLCYIHRTNTNCSPRHDLPLTHVGLCPWPTCRAWVTIVRKKWLSPFYSTKVYHQTYTNCSSRHNLPMPYGGLCLFATFYAWVTMARKKWWIPFYNTCYCTKCTPTVHPYMILTWYKDVLSLFISFTYISRLTNCSSWRDLPIAGSGVPVMVPITMFYFNFISCIKLCVRLFYSRIRFSLNKMPSLLLKTSILAKWCISKYMQHTNPTFKIIYVE